MTKPKTPDHKGAPVVVTTAHRGVFFGYLSHQHEDTLRLADARLCVYWSRAMRGFMGLAAFGPDKDCKIGPKVAGIQLRNVTAVIEATPAAVKAWEAAPWAK